MLMAVMWQASLFSWAMAVGSLLVSATTYVACVVARTRGWYSFEPVSPEWSPVRDPWVIKVSSALLPHPA